MGICESYGERYLNYEKKEGVQRWVEVPLNVASKKASQDLREGIPPGGNVKYDRLVYQKIKGYV